MADKYLDLAGLNYLWGKITTYVDGATTSINNIKDGSATGSIRTVGSVEEDNNYTIGSHAFAEGYQTKASGDYSHAEGGQFNYMELYVTYSGTPCIYNVDLSYYDLQKVKIGSPVMGYNQTTDEFEILAYITDIDSTNGAITTSESIGTSDTYILIQLSSWPTTASGIASHAEGFGTKAVGDHSHAEGVFSIASGKHSHAEGGGDGTNESGDSDESIVVFTVEYSGTPNVYNVDPDYEGELSLCNVGNIIVDEWSYIEDSIINNIAYITDIDLTNYTITTSESIGTDSTIGVRVILSSLSSGDYSHAEGRSTVASGYTSHAEGKTAIASGRCAHAEGSNFTTASGDTSHAEGSSTTASNQYSHAEGNATTASGDTSHAEGSYTTASGQYSHAEGKNTVASGYVSHAQNRYTIAAGQAQTAIGRYNIADTSGTGTYAFIIGNGTSDSNRKNAFTVDWNGSAVASGNIISENSSEANLIARYASNAGIGMYANSSGVRGIFDYNKSNYLMYASTGDTWLYLNRGDIYTDGIYCGTTTLRTDGKLRVGNGTAPYTDITKGQIYVNGAANSQTSVTCYSGSNANCIYIETETDGRVVLGSRTNEGSWCNIITRANNSTEITAGGVWTIPIRPWQTGISGTAVISDGADKKRVSLLSCNSSTQFYIQGQWGTSGTTYAGRYVTVSTSDIRLKENIKDSTVSALPVINSIKMREFDWKEDGRHLDLGFVADELEEINPNFSMGGGYTEDGVMDVKCVDTFNLTAYLTKAVQELSTELNESKSQIDELKQEVSELKELIKNHIQSNK